ncbi:hypothetical protein HPB51_028279 [Rhipicephalus microplus]|uniref:Uncharacterized protein n=1 Tax=Rhipicephalus microplus TaxID=6941 RepID=A0A9J6CXD6_RHIMP|nr:hypothetical protein HPB51_028279 [Rhipicephalus microplus]
MSHRTDVCLIQNRTAVRVVARNTRRSHRAPNRHAVPAASFVRAVTQRTVRTANTVSLRSLRRSATHRRKNPTKSHNHSSHQSFAPITHRPKSSRTRLSASHTSSNIQVIPDPTTMADPSQGQGPGPGLSPALSRDPNPDRCLILLATSTRSRYLSPPPLVRPRDRHCHRPHLVPRTLPGPKDPQLRPKRHHRRRKMHR